VAEADGDRGAPLAEIATRCAPISAIELNAEMLEDIVRERSDPA